VTKYKHTTPVADGSAAQAGSASHGFESPEGLRSLLIRLHESGPGAWHGDHEAAELMRHTAVKYRPLARKNGLDPWDVASAAFEVMLTASTRDAGNPWAVVTHAVKITCHTEVRAEGPLVATDQARHADRFAGCHDALRFTERDRLTDYHPSFAVNPTTDDEAGPSENDKRVTAVLSNTVGLFVAAGWDAARVNDCVAYVASRLGDLGSRSHTMETLRRDHTVPTLLGVPPRSWTALLRIVLGHPSPQHAGTPAGDGVLLRLLNGEPADALHQDAALTEAIRAANPIKRPKRRTTSVLTGQAVRLTA
jgi:hypothetical protein